MKNKILPYLVGTLIGALIVGTVIAFSGKGELFQGSLSGIKSISNTPNLSTIDPTILALQTRVTTLETNQPNLLALPAKLAALENNQSALATQAKSLNDKVNFIQAQLSCLGSKLSDTVISYASQQGAKQDYPLVAYAKRVQICWQYGDSNADPNNPF